MEKQQHKPFVYFMKKKNEKKTRAHKCIDGIMR